MTNNNSITTTGQNSLELTFPTAKRVSERRRIDIVTIKWKDYRKQHGITDETPIARVKEVQRDYNNMRKQTSQVARQLSSGLLTDERFKSFGLDLWTDSKGNLRFNVKGSSAEVKEIGSKNTNDSEKKSLQDYSKEELLKELEKRG